MYLTRFECSLAHAPAPGRGAMDPMAMMQMMGGMGGASGGLPGGVNPQMAMQMMQNPMMQQMMQESTLETSEVFLHSKRVKYFYTRNE